MGNGRSSNQCLQHLGIPTDLQKKFRRIVLQYVERENRYGGDLPSATYEDLSQICTEFLSSPEFLKFQYSFTDSPEAPSDNDESHDWLLQLVNNWIGEKKKQQSQEDPSYSEDAYRSGASDSASGSRKKRKRNSDRVSPPKSTAERSSRRHQAMASLKKEPPRTIPKPVIMSPRSGRQREIAPMPRSPTLEGYAESTQDLPFQPSPESDSLDSFPPLTELISPTSSRKEQHPDGVQTSTYVNSSAKKGKLQSANSPSPTTPKSPVQTSTEQQPASPISLHVDANLDPKPLRRMTYAFPDDDEDDHNDRVVDDDTNTILPKPLSFDSSTIQQASNPSALLTPPPTVRRPQFTEPNLRTPVQATSHHNQSSFKARVQDVLDEIQAYIHTCETHSNRIVRDASSSPRERQYHHIRAAAFAHLKVDICSRVDAFIERENGGSEDIPITEHCLHYP